MKNKIKDVIKTNSHVLFNWFSGAITYGEMADTLAIQINETIKNPPKYKTAVEAFYKWMQSRAMWDEFEAEYYFQEGECIISALESGPIKDAIVSNLCWFDTERGGYFYERLHDEWEDFCDEYTA